MDVTAWEDIFTSQAGIDAASSSTYATNFAQHRMTRAGIAALDRATLTEMGVTTLGHAMAILAITKQPAPAPAPAAAPVVPAATPPVVAPPVYAKPPAATAPQITEEMTSQQWRKFMIDWQVFVTITNLPDKRLHAQLYSCCSPAVQTALLNTHACSHCDESTEADGEVQPPVQRCTRTHFTMRITN